MKVITKTSINNNNNNNEYLTDPLQMAFTVKVTILLLYIYNLLKYLQKKGCLLKLKLITLFSSIN